MSTTVPKAGAIATAACFVAGLVLFLVLNSSFGGPTPLQSLVTSEPYRLTTSFDDAEGLLTKSLVLVRGVQVGEVERVEVRDERALVTFTVDDRYAPVPEGTTARLGNRTVFGEKYVDLDVPASDPLPATERALAPGADLPTRPTIPLDEALNALNDRRRGKLVDILDEVARGTRSPQAAERMSETYVELAAVTEGVRDLTDELVGQEDDIAGLVDGSRVALSALGAREESLRRIVGSGRVTLEAVAARRESLEAALGELPPTLDATRSTLASSRPLLVEARPLIDDLIEATPALRGVVRDLRPVSLDAVEVVRGLRPLRQAAEPVVRSALPALDALLPVARKLEPATRNLVPVARYLSPYEREASAFFSNLGASTGGDSRGRWLRVFLQLDPATYSSGNPPPVQCRPGSEPPEAPFCNNAYPEPGDAADNEPFDGYPRLRPLEAPPPR